MLNAVVGGHIEYREDRRAVWLVKDAPLWFVPNQSAQRLLEKTNGRFDRQQLVNTWLEMGQKDAVTASFEVDSFVDSLCLPHEIAGYQGRKGLGLSALREVWFHLTDECNLRCRHCLFSDNFAKKRQLSPEIIIQTIKEALGLGLQLVCFTGGEPFCYPDFSGLARRILALDSALQVAVLTNGTLLDNHKTALKEIDRDRFHLQISLDGVESVNDAIRGSGTYKRVLAGIKAAQDSGLASSISLAVNPVSLAKAQDFVVEMAQLPVKNLHLMWHFPRGNGKNMAIDLSAETIKGVTSLARKALSLGISVDNWDAALSAVFSPPMTRFDLGSAGFEVIAVAPDGSIYPSPALVDAHTFRAGNVREGIEKVWRNSPVFEAVRAMSWTEISHLKDDPWGFVLGGGDMDHFLARASFSSQGDFLKDSGRFLEPDPYYPIYKAFALLAIEDSCKGIPDIDGRLGLLLKMGDVTADCPSAAEINFNHCNCLLSLAETGYHRLISQFYGKRAIEADETILNPVPCPQGYEDIIPQSALARRYGCGSPVSDANLKHGETVLDLGSGTGVECFIASHLTGASGKVYGLDMTDEMLEMANSAAKQVGKRLGWQNVTFLKGYLEAIPLEADLVDCVISNCVVNLSSNKRRVFAEIFRTLKPGGRLVISDIVTETEPSRRIRADHTLSGECIAGAMVQGYLFSMLKDMGFCNARILKRFPYRTVEGHLFYSLTFTAEKPVTAPKSREFIYSGPFQAVITDDGTVLKKGVKTRCEGGSSGLAVSSNSNDELLRLGIYEVDDSTGNFLNLASDASCSCCAPSPSSPTISSPCDCVTSAIKGEAVIKTGCLVCGKELAYTSDTKKVTCDLCGMSFETKTICPDGHFICDKCHANAPLLRVKNLLLSSHETDLITLFKKTRHDAGFPLHGPEHHGLVPGVILTAYRNTGAGVTDRQILDAIKKGGEQPGGACGYLGVCGAATGAGIAFASILESSPIKARQRASSMNVVGSILSEMSRIPAPRCCQRECYIALKQAAIFSETLLPVRLTADDVIKCTQSHLNRECIRKACQLFVPTNV